MVEFLKNKKDNELTINVTIPEMKKILEDVSWTFTSIPNSCYVVNVDSPDSVNYEIFYKGEKLETVFGVILDRVLEKEYKNKDIHKNIDWQKELGD